MRISLLKWAVIYFALVFGAGFALGTARVLWLVPRVGTRAAELIESPFMLVATVLAAWWVVRRFGRGGEPRTFLGVGLIAVGFVLAADFVVGVGLRGMTPSEVFTERDAVSGPVYYGLLGVFAVMPWLVARKLAFKEGGLSVPKTVSSRTAGPSAPTR